jgi:hypothetical protein
MPKKIDDFFEHWYSITVPSGKAEKFESRFNEEGENLFMKRENVNGVAIFDLAFTSVNKGIPSYIRGLMNTYDVVDLYDRNKFL